MLREWDESIMRLCVQTERELRPDRYRNDIVYLSESQQREIGIRCIRRSQVIRSTIQRLLSDVRDDRILRAQQRLHRPQGAVRHVAAYLSFLDEEWRRTSRELRAAVAIIGKTHWDMMRQLDLFGEKAWLEDPLYTQLIRTPLASALSEEDARACFESMVAADIPLPDTNSNLHS